MTAQKVAKRRPPQEVESSISLWLTAVGAGIAETLLRVAQAFSTQAAPGSTVWDAAVRMMIYTVLWSLALRLRRGEHWVRVALAVTLGAIGTLCTLVPVLTSMATGYSTLDFLADSDGWELLFAVLRAGQVVAALFAVATVFQAASNRFFLRARVSGRARKRPPSRKAESAGRRR
ncbi:hypothetical protein [Parasphingorhabdus pacifica]